MLAGLARYSWVFQQGFASGYFQADSYMFKANNTDTTLNVEQFLAEDKHCKKQLFNYC